MNISYFEIISRYKKTAFVSFTVMFIIMSFIISITKSDNIGGLIFFFITASIGSWLNFIKPLRKENIYKTGTIKVYKDHYVVFYGANNLVVIPRVNNVLSFYVDRINNQHRFCLRLGYIGCYSKEGFYSKPLHSSPFFKKLVWAVGSAKFEKKIFPFKCQLFLGLIVAILATYLFFVSQSIGLAFAGMSIGCFVSSMFFLYIRLQKDFMRGRIREFHDKNISLLKVENGITIKIQYKDKDIYVEKINHIVLHTVKIGFIEGPCPPELPIAEPGNANGQEKIIY